MRSRCQNRHARLAHNRTDDRLTNLRDQSSSSRHIRQGVIQQILLHANVTITINIYVKTVSSDATVAMKALETMCATSVQPLALASTRMM